jgi:hypothetical protein
VALETLSVSELLRQELGGAGFAPAKAELPSGLQPDPFVYLGTHPLPSLINLAFF